MTRAIYYTAATLNGFLADEHDSLAWLLDIPQEEATADIADFMSGMGVLVEGSSTYEWVLREEDLLVHPGRWQAFYGDRPTFVFTSRSLPVVPGADIRFVSGPVADHWDDIVASAGGRDVWIVGGGDLAGQVADAGHLDEIVVTIAPATLRAGKPLLPRDLDHRRLELIGARQAGPFAELTYRLVPPSVD
ncbi:dihydrofolate reductase family protein [Microbacterium capsulatum]|uniref:Dihydrofolate reductase family protein n=1 Tax=Microbacterium capsulatum TaxID=3041921 RepID=A0ABU0XCK5_9MICO|nr:dihydrofolate reductase family protein [Microbacterium sp. ASV81]MDQ4212818.1 dihydrofolate reductase family protein [Microbacterium sp. ASV81]